MESSQILNQIFGHQLQAVATAAEKQSSFAGQVSTGGRNQYVELERFESEEQFQQWLTSQGRKWGIVQKGRVTIEDIIDQYACVYRRRKGYACRVQMRVRHNRRSGFKVVEILPIPHNHNFYGVAMPQDFVDDQPVSMVNPQQFNKEFAAGFKEENSDFDQDYDDFQPADEGDDNFDVKQEFGGQDLSLMDQQAAEMNLDEQQTAQPMEMLWSNILNNPAIQQLTGVMGQEDDLDQSDRRTRYVEQNEGDGAGEEQQLDQQTEALANFIAEKVAGCLAVQFESKFESILNLLGSLTKSVDELKCTVAAQHQWPSGPPKLVPMSQSAASSKSGQPSQLLRPFIQSALKQKTPQISSKQQSSGQELVSRQNKMPNILSSLTGPSSRPSPPPRPANQSFNNGPSSANPTPTGAVLPMGKPTRKEFPQSTSVSGTKAPPANLAMPIRVPPSLLVNKARFALGLGLNSPMNSSRKSVHAYRQRRRELSYKFMKEVGMSLSINGSVKSIFLWRTSEISLACQTKRRELAEAGKRVMYRGTDVTDELYRVDCSKDLVNGRRCGQRIADSLWPRGYFQTRMLMPIMKGVSHRAKKRGDGSARRPVAGDQFEIFKVALLLLGGFLMDESDRSKWMETAREGVNQRGLDELANSKRAHYEYEGGPLFGWEDGNEEEEEEQDVEDEESGEHGQLKMEQAGEEDGTQKPERSAPLAGMPLNLDFLHQFVGNDEEMGDDPPPELFQQE